MEKNRKMPVLAQALGAEWQSVAPLVRVHYGLHPDSSDVVVLTGVMSVHYALPAILLLGFARLLGGLVLLREDNVQVTVENSSRPGASAMYWYRSFLVPGKKKPVIFRSYMEYARGDEIVEFIGAHEGFGMGIRMKVSQDQGVINFKSTGYLLKIGAFQIPIPGHLILGSATIFEKALDDDTISMGFTIKHPVWGTMYTYSGIFRSPISSQK